MFGRQGRQTGELLTADGAFTGYRPLNWKIGDRPRFPSMFSLLETVVCPRFCRGRDAAAAYLRDLVEDVKASGLVAKWIEKSGVKGLSVAPPAGK